VLELKQAQRPLRTCLKDKDFEVSEFTETIIVGGGQAGLAISYCLKQEGREHLVPRASACHCQCLAQSALGFIHTGDSELPSADARSRIRRNDPYGFMSLREVVKYFDDYDQRYRLPVRCGVEVQGVEKRESVFQARTTDRDYEAKNVVIATGLYQSPKIPAFAAGIPADILQLHSMQYRNPSVLPHGAVLVIGTGQSGAQIARNFISRKEGLSLDRQRRPRAPSISRKGHQ